jgi:hypothetical protein
MLEMLLCQLTQEHLRNPYAGAIHAWFGRFEFVNPLIKPVVLESFEPSSQVNNRQTAVLPNGLQRLTIQAVLQRACADENPRFRVSDPAKAFA